MGSSWFNLRFDKVSAIKDSHVTTARRELHEMSHGGRSAGNHLQGIEEDECCGREVEESEVEELRPGNAPRGTVHLVQLHQQLKSIL